MSLINPSTPPSVKISASSLLLVQSVEEAAPPVSLKKPPPPTLAIEANNEFTTTSVSFQDLLNENLSPSPLSKPRKPKPPFVAEEGLDTFAAMIAARRKIRASSSMGCASPKNTSLRPRRRLEKEEACVPDSGDAQKQPKKRRQATKPRPAGRKESTTGFTPPSVSSSPCPLSGPQSQAYLIGENKLDCLAISDLIMWKNSAKSALWFGLGSIFFLSSPFSGDFSGFSIVSAVSHVGIIALAVAFFYDSFSKSLLQQQKGDGECGFGQLTEDDLLHAARVVLPLVNSAVAKIRVFFSGEPSTTLKAAPILLLGARYGHMITLWRILATGFFLGFTAPKLCSLYSQQIHTGVEGIGRYAEEAWNSCPRKKVVVSSAAFAFWNLTSAKTRIFAAFLCVVMLRYRNLKRISFSSEEVAVSVVTVSSEDGESSTTTSPPPQQDPTVEEAELADEMAADVESS